MNLPNKLTMLRMFMIPLFLVFFFTLNNLWAFIVFGLASLTDLLDGHIARKYGLITDFGKLMDPLADKLLVMSALCCILPLYQNFGIIALILILSREFMVTSIRLIAASKGEVLAADIWGKVKTVMQMVWICTKLFIYALSELSITAFPDFSEIIYAYVHSNAYMLIDLMLLIIMVTITVASGVHYIVKNRKLFADA